MTQAVSGKITGMQRAISTSRMLPCSNASAHHARQSGVGGAISLIVFSVNLSGITGIVRKVIKKPDDFS
jgi:hypothetical protein